MNLIAKTGGGDICVFLQVFRLPPVWCLQHFLVGCWAHANAPKALDLAGTLHLGFGSLGKDVKGTQYRWGLKKADQLLWKCGCGDVDHHHVHLRRMGRGSSFLGFFGRETLFVRMAHYEQARSVCLHCLLRPQSEFPQGVTRAGS